jgi:phosphoenolpyruvate carboxylase
MPNRDIEFSDKDVSLREDVTLLGAMVGDLLREQVGSELFAQVELVRHAAIDRRSADHASEQKLVDALVGLDLDNAEQLVRAFSSYFQVVNLAERVHRVRRLREYQRDRSRPTPGGLEETLGMLQEKSFGLSSIEALIGTLQIEPVFTAHPTESTRRTILEKEHAVVAALLERLDSSLTPARKRATLERIRDAITSAWQTEPHPRQRPRVEDEMEHVLFYLADVLFEVLPDFYADLTDALKSAFGEAAHDVRLPLLLRFGSWVGGDMDGNPNVTADSIRETLVAHRRLAIGCYLPKVERLARALSQSVSRIEVSEAVTHRVERYTALLPEFAASIPPRYHNTPYRCLLTFVAQRLRLSLEGEPEAYENCAEFLSDLQMIGTSLASNRGQNAGLGALQRLRLRARTFGFHMAALDVRQDSLVHRQAVAALRCDPNWTKHSASLRARTLTAALDANEKLPIVEGAGVADTLAVFAAIDELRGSFGGTAIGTFIVSMTEGADDLLSVLWLARQADLEVDGQVPLDVVPLLETVSDLQAGPEILESLLINPHYRAHLTARGDCQQIMVGYSDSNKDGGIAAARWALHRAQEELAGVARKHAVKLTFFHGRGGTVSRGGGNTRDGILSAPRGTVDGRFRVTEQGEVINQKFGIEEIALRNLEVVSAAVMRATALPNSLNLEENHWREMMESLAGSARQTYRSLVYDTPEFINYFRSATPIDVIERLAIGSRPAARRSQQGIESLRAIPWVFSWAQTRTGLPGSYGLGTALAETAGQFGEDPLREMLDWPVFACLINDVEMVLAKSDLDISSRYARLAPDSAQGLYARIEAELRLTEEWILRLKGTDQLLARDETLQRAIRLRNPYVDPINLLQIDLLARWRETRRKDDELLKALFSTVNGIAQGIQNTG